MGHWITKDGNHVFIEDSSGGTVLKGKVEKTEPPIPKGDGKNKEPDGGGSTGGGGTGGGTIPPKEKNPLWEFIKKIAPLIIHEIYGNGHNYVKPSNSSSQSDTNRITENKSQIDHVVQQVKTSISEEYDKLQKMVEDISAMPKGIERDAKWQKVLSKGAELDNAKSVVDRVESFNNHDMPNEIIKEIDKLSASLPQNYVKDLQPMGSGGSSPHNSSMSVSVQNVPESQNYSDKFAGMSVPTGNDRTLFDMAKAIPSQVAGHPIPPYPISTEFAHNSITWLRDVSKNNPNAVVLHGAKDVNNTQLRSYLQDRIHNVLHLPDARGVFYKENSNVAREVALSPEFQKAILDNADKLLKNQEIKTIPLDFKTPDLAKSLGHASIYKAWIDKDKSLNAIIYDIYDFDKIKNPHTQTEKINNQMYYWQTHNNIENYFVIIFVKI